MSDEWQGNEQEQASIAMYIQNYLALVEQRKTRRSYVI